MWLLSSNKFSLRNIRSITEFDLFVLSKYLVGTWLVDLDRHKSIKSTMLVRRSLLKKWYEKDRFQILSLMLKSLIMIKTLWILTSVSFRYFKAVWLKSK